MFLRFDTIQRDRRIKNSRYIRNLQYSKRKFFSVLKYAIADRWKRYPHVLQGHSKIALNRIQKLYKSDQKDHASDRTLK